MDAGELFLAQAGKKVSLIFGLVRGFAQKIPSGVFIPPDPGIVSGDHAVAFQFQRPAQKPVELQMAVAVNTGIGGQPVFVAGNKFADYLGFEILLKIKYIMGNPQALRHAAGVFRVIKRAAGSGLLQSQHFIVIQPHGGANAAVACILHQKSRHRAVNTAAHSNQCPLFLHLSHLRRICFEYSNPSRESQWKKAGSKMFRKSYKNTRRTGKDPGKWRHEARKYLCMRPNGNRVDEKIVTEM